MEFVQTVNGPIGAMLAHNTSPTQTQMKNGGQVQAQQPPQHDMAEEYKAGSVWSIARISSRAIYVIIFN
jgi:hypothetical protein